MPNKMEGLGFYTQEICRRLVERHPEHRFFFYFDRAYDPRFIFGKSVTPRVVFPPARHPILWKIWFDYALPRYLRKDQLDLFLSPDSFASLTYSGRQMMVIHDLGFEHYPEHVPPRVRNFYQKNTPRYAHHCEHVFAVSETTLEDIHVTYGVSKDKMSVAYNGVRQPFSPKKKGVSHPLLEEMAQGQPYFLFVGAMHPRKNIAQLLRAFDLFRKKAEKPYRLLVTGRKAWMTADIEAVYNAMEFKDDVAFLGYLQVEDLSILTANAHVCAYPSLFEGFGVPLLEAMNCGVPVVTSNISCMPEIAGDAAVLVDPRSAESIAQGLQRVVEDEELYQVLSKNALRQAKKFSWDQSAEVIAKRMGL